MLGVERRFRNGGSGTTNLYLPADDQLHTSAGFFIRRVHPPVANHPPRNLRRILQRIERRYCEFRRPTFGLPKIHSGKRESDDFKIFSKLCEASLPTWDRVRLNVAERVRGS
jgi:hypothetical protein